MKIIIGSDHAGFRLKSFLVHALTLKGHEVEDLGTDSAEHSVDYPDFAAAVAAGWQQIPQSWASSSAAPASAPASPPTRSLVFVAPSFMTGIPHGWPRSTTTPNVLALGGRTTAEEIALDCIDTWLSATYQGGRHQPRIDKISALDCPPGSGTK